MLSNIDLLVQLAILSSFPVSCDTTSDPSSPTLGFQQNREFLARCIDRHIVGYRSIQHWTHVSIDTSVGIDRYMLATGYRSIHQCVSIDTPCVSIDTPCPTVSSRDRFSNRNDLGSILEARDREHVSPHTFPRFRSISKSFYISWKTLFPDLAKNLHRKAWNMMNTKNIPKIAIFHHHSKLIKIRFLSCLDDPTRLWYHCWDLWGLKTMRKRINHKYNPGSWV